MKKKRESTRFERIEGGFSVVLPVDVRQHVCIFYSDIRFITIKIPYNFMVCKDKLRLFAILFRHAKIKVLFVEFIRVGVHRMRSFACYFPGKSDQGLQAVVFLV